MNKKAILPKLLTILLTLAMALAILPVNVFAVNYINSLYVDGVIKPVFDDIADFNWNIPNYRSGISKDNSRGYDCLWVESDIEPTGYEELYAYNRFTPYDAPCYFSYGKYYTFIAFTCADVGFEYGDFRAYINGKEANVHQEDNYAAAIWYTFCPEVISSLKIHCGYGGELITDIYYGNHHSAIV